MPKPLQFQLPFIIQLILIPLVMTGCTETEIALDQNFFEITEQTALYTEYKLVQNSNDFLPTQTAREALKASGVLRSHGEATIPLTSDLFEADQYSTQAGENGVCSDCYVVKYKDDTYIIDYFTPNEYRIRISKNDDVIFEGGAIYGSDGPVRTIEFLDGNIIVSYLSRLKYAPIQTFWEGGHPDEFKDFEGVRSVFEYNGRIGFIASEPEYYTYLYYDGAVISPGYDGIPLTQCCAQEPPYFELFSNGVINLVGVRDEEKFFLEVDLGE